MSDETEHKEIKSKQEVYDFYQQHFSDAKQFVGDDKLFQAHDSLTTLHNMFSKLSNSELADVKELSQRLLAKLEEEEVFKICSTRINECKNLLGQIESDDGWTLSWDTDSYTTLYREEEDYGTYSFKVRGTLNASVYRILACIYEVDLYDGWWPYISESSCLATPSRFRKYGTLTSTLPYPISNRESIVDGYGIDNSKENYVLIFIRSLLEENWDPQDGSTYPPDDESIVRAKINMGGFLIKPISRDVTEVHYMLNIDPQLAYVPYYLVNMFTGQFIHTILESLRKAAQFDDDSIYAQRTKENKAVYQYLKDTAEEYWSKREQKELDEKQANAE